MNSLQLREMRECIHLALWCLTLVASFFGQQHACWGIRNCIAITRWCEWWPVATYGLPLAPLPSRSPHPLVEGSGICLMMSLYASVSSSPGSSLPHLSMLRAHGLLDDVFVHLGVELARLLAASHCMLNTHLARARLRHMFDRQPLLAAPIYEHSFS